MATYRFRRTFMSSDEIGVLSSLVAVATISWAFWTSIERASFRDRRSGNHCRSVDVCLPFLPKDETGHDFAASHPNVHPWLGRITTLPSWRPHYELLPAKRLPHFQ